MVGATMSASEAARYHALQARAFAEAGAAMITAVTMTYTQEAIGVTRAAQTVGLPVVISFTVETDGALPSGQSLHETIDAVDTATDGYPEYYMINCAHPSHFGHLLDESPCSERVSAIRANASKLSHAELDEADELDTGDPAELAADYLALHTHLPQLAVLGGCCGTDHRHIEAIATACILEVRS